MSFSIQGKLSDDSEKVSDQQKESRRMLQTQNRTTIVGLFEALKTVVCPPSHNDEASSNQTSSAKWKILDHALGFLLEKEAYLSKLLALKEIYVDDDDGPKSLEDVQEQYRTLYSDHFLYTRRHQCSAQVPDVDESHESSEIDSADEETDELPQCQPSGSSVPHIQEFEGETLERLLHSGVLTPDQTGLSVVSETISGLWSSLPPARRVEAQQHAVNHSSVSWEGQTEIAATPLTISNPSALYVAEEDLLQDAYDVVQRDMEAASINRPAALQSCDSEKLSQIYKDISGFLMSHMVENQDFPQDLSHAAEFDEQLLRCSESFDEDF